MSFKRLVLLSFLALIYFMLAESYESQATNISCRQRPRKLIKTAKACCTTPEPYLDDFIDLCFNGNANNKTLRCQLECLFNVANVYKENILNLARLHKMLEKIFPDASDFVAAFYISFEQCIPLVKTILAEIKISEGVKSKCQPAPIMYAACAQMKLLKNCPRNAWNSTQSCENARLFVEKCENNLLPHRRKLRTGDQLKMQPNENLNNNSLAIFGAENKN